MYWKDDSRCKKGVLCQFELSRDLPDARIEICTSCSKKVIYNKSEGQIDEIKYLRDHKRDTIQPYGKDKRLFIQIYGQKPISTVEKWKSKFVDRKKRNELRKELEEKRLFLRKKAFQGMGMTNKELLSIPKKIKKTGFQ